jgi:hypothetical protein
MMTDTRESDRYILVEGPRWGDAEFYGKWLLAAADAEAIWKAIQTDHAFTKRVRILTTMFIPDFGIAASIIVMQLEKALSTSIIPLHSYLGEEFVMLLQMGFFVHTGNRYQMVIPTKVSVSKVKSGLLEYAKTEDDECCLHPEHLVPTISYPEAKAWEDRLRAMDQVLRLADRTVLLNTGQ